VYLSDDDDLNKPLPEIPTTTSSGSSSSSSSDSFYSEPLYGITNQITKRQSSLKNPGPPVPDTLRRPSLSPNPLSSVISCNNVIRNEPIYQKSKKHAQSTKSGCSSAYGSTMYGYNGAGGADYADSITNAHSLNPNANKSCGESSGNFPNDKLPPLPPSKFTSIAKSAGKKLAKKFLGIRKTSKSSLENYDAPSSSASSTNGSLSGCPTTSSSRLSNPSCMTNGNGVATPVGNNNKGMAPPIPQSQPKKLLSRPSIPPPEPPKSLYGGSSNGSAKSFSINQELPSMPPPQQQERHDHHNQDDDDDDFDDSDFYDSDSELIRNFVSQVQPIYSMEEEPLYQYYAYGISSKVKSCLRSPINCH